MELFVRYPANPIIQPGPPAWRQAVTFNPAVIADPAGGYALIERVSGGFRPFHCSLGLQHSPDGIHFEQVGDAPVFTPAMAGSEHGSVQDPRIVALDGTYYLSFAFRPFAWASHPTGVGVPESHQVDFPGFSGKDADNQTRSGLATSIDLREWIFHSWVTAPTIDDRNVILFPEKIGGRYAVLRRPSTFVGTLANHASKPGIMLSWSQDLCNWTDPEPLLQPSLAWEDNRIGGSTPPIRTEAGWLVFYHAVQTLDANQRRVCYRMGAVLLDLENPFKVLARAHKPLLEPVEYYERVGAYIPNVVFPTSALLRDEDFTGQTAGGPCIWLYYGCCDTCIGLACASLEVVLSRLQP
ncbi:MAG: glycosidase [Opitutales bacterium]